MPLQPPSRFAFFLSRIAVAVVLVTGAITALVAAPLSVTSSATPRKSLEISPKELQAINELQSKFPYDVIFDSNRSGTFGIYLSDLSGKEARAIVDSSEYHEMYPSLSPDGTKLAFGRYRTLSRLEPGEVWILNIEDGSLERVAESGTFPTFRADGKGIYFERQRQRVMELDLESGELRSIYPKDRTRFKKSEVVKPKVSPDGKAVAFSANRPKAWYAWQGSLIGKKAVNLGNGCEPIWFHTTNELLYVNRDGKAESGLYRVQPDGSARKVVIDREDPWGHEYFPSLTRDDQFVLYSSSPRAEDHSHIDANYQLFVKRIGDESEPIRITYDEATNRWPQPVPKGLFRE